MLNKARAIRYQAFVELKLSKSNREYLYALEEMLSAMDAEDVIENMETIIKEAKKDGF